ncbi:MAG: methyltransferase domain-containing protein [Pseudomonadota bacterium]
MNKDIPAPSVMPIDRETWAGELHLSNFDNTYYQYRDLRLCGDVKKLLIIGPGQGLDTQVLKWREYEVTTFDIDKTFNPDAIGSVHGLSIYDDGSFDAIIVSHVLEHLAVPYLDRCLSELSRVGKYCLIYLPVAGRHFQLRLKMDLKGIDLSYIFDLFNFFHRPDGVTPRYCQGQHYWEIGMRGFRVADLVRRFEKHFEVIIHYRNCDWNASYNFVLRPKRVYASYYVLNCL